MTIRKLTVAAAIAVGIATCSFNTVMAACPCDQRPIVKQSTCGCKDLPVVTGQACPLWVPLVENGEADSSGADYFVKKYIDALLDQDPLIDTIILGCTHYPLLLEKIKKYTPQGIKVVCQGEYVAASLKDYLVRHPEMDERCSKEGRCRFYTTESVEKFVSSASLFLHESIDVQHTSLG